MDFDQALARTINLLERQGFATYRTLRRRFHLDDATLAALKTTLVDTQHLATEDAGTRLVWLGTLRPGTGPTRLEEEDTPLDPGASRHPPVPDHRPSTPLVGRASEVALLQARWTSVLAGQGQVVTLGGEAGMGKSRLVQVVKAQGAVQSVQLWECHCDPSLQHSALAPLIEVLQRVLHLQPEAAPADKLAPLEAALTPLGLALSEVVPLLASVLSVPFGACYALPSLAQQKQRTLTAIGTLLAAMAAQVPVLLIVEDVHWADPSTLELLTLLVHQVQTLRCYLLLTHRPEFQAPWAPPGHSTALTLRRLGPAEVTALVTQVAGDKTLPAAAVEQILARTDGIPLFVEEVTQMVLASGQLVEQADAYELSGPFPALAIPSTVQESVRARLASLGAAALHVAQVAAVWGRAATESQLQATLGLEGWRRDRALGRLVAAAILHELSLPPRLTYVFKHALLQEVAYTMLPDDLRRTLHAQVAQCLVEREPETVATQPERVAQHYTAAGLIEPALPYWQRAGRRAIERSANLEAIDHLTRGLALLKQLAPTPDRLQQELAFQTALGPALMVTRGFAAPEVAQTYHRAHELCQQVGESPQLFSILWGIGYFYSVRPESQKALEVAQQLCALAQRAQDSTLLMIAHRLTGALCMVRGEFVAGVEQLRQGLALYQPQQHRALAFVYGQDIGVICQQWSAWMLWLLGYPEQALQMTQAALQLAHEVSHPFTLAYALTFSAILHQFRRETARARELAACGVRLATEQGFGIFIAFAKIVLGEVVEPDDLEAGLVQTREGIAAFRATGAESLLPWHLIQLAEVSRQAKQPEAGLAALAEARAIVERGGEHTWDAERARVQGELMLMQGEDAAAEACLHTALAIARRQSAKSWELRAAMSLGRLWQQRGRQDAVRGLLTPIYAWFTEGFDTADLQEAKALLEELGG